MIKPLADRIVIKVIDDVQQTSGGIFIPDSAKEKPQKGEVVAVGSGKTLDNGEKEAMEVKVGDVVLFAKYSGTDVKIDDVEYKIIAVILFILTGFFILLSVGIILVHAQKAMPKYLGVISGVMQGFSWGLGALFLAPLIYFATPIGNELSFERAIMELISS